MQTVHQNLSLFFKDNYCTTVSDSEGMNLIHQPSVCSNKPWSRSKPETLGADWLVSLVGLAM
jgi:hypothetical protein